MQGCVRRLLRLSAAASLLLLIVPVAHAQPAPEGRYEFGGFMSFTPTVTFVGGHDTNHIRTPSGVSASEYYFAPQVEGWVGRGRTKVNFASAVSYQGETAQHSSVWNHFNSARINLGGPRLRIQGLLSHRNHYAPPTDFVGFAIGFKSQRIENIFEGIVDYKPGRLGVGAVIRQSQLRYDPDERFLGNSLQFQLNRNDFTVGGSMSVSITPFSSVLASVDLTRSRFLYNPAGDGNGFRFLVGGEFSPGALFSGRAQVGYMRYTTVQTQRTYSAPSYLVGLSLDRGPVFFDVSGSRVIDLSFDPSRGFYVTTGLDAYSSFRIGRSWETFLRGSLRHLTPQGFISGDQQVKRISITKGGVAYRLGRLIRVGSEVERYNWGAPGAFHGVRVTAFVIYGAGRVIRLDRPLPGEF
jgi:hypothetical protein